MKEHRDSKNILCDSTYIKYKMSKNQSMPLEIKIVGAGHLTFLGMGTGYTVHSFRRTSQHLYFSYVHCFVCMLFFNKNFKMCSWCFGK